MTTDMSSGLGSNTNYLPSNLSTEQSSQISQPGVIDPATKSYDLKDVISSMYDIHYVPIHFANHLTEYLAEVWSPLLPVPKTEFRHGIGKDKGQTKQKPYNASEQQVVRQVYANSVQSQLQALGLSEEQIKQIFNALVNEHSTDSLPPELVSIATAIDQQATSYTQEQCRLPNTWTMASTEEASWTPSPPTPYTEEQQTDINTFYQTALQTNLDAYIASANPPLSEEQISELKNAIATGTPSAGITEDFEQVVLLATEQTQKTYGLPDTWTIGSTNVKDWTPVNLGPMSPLSLARASLTNMLQSSIQTLEDLASAARGIMESLPPDDPNRVALSDFLDKLGDIIQEVKEILRQIQISDSQKNQEFTNAEISMQTQRREDQKAMADQVEKQKKKQKKMETVGFAMKIVGPIVAAIGVAAGVAFSVLTFGLGTPVGVAIVAVSITIGIMMIGYTVADSTMNLTTKMVDSFNRSMERLSDKVGADSEMEKVIVKTVVVTTIAAAASVILIAACLTGSGVGATTNVATQATTQAVQAAIREATKQITIQVMMMMVMSTNTFPELVGEIMKKCHVSKEAKMAAEIITMIAVLTALMIGASAATGTGIGQVADDLDLVDEAASSTAKSASTVAVEAQAATQGTQASATAAARSASNAIREAQEAAAEATQAAVDQAIKEASNQSLNLIQQSIRETFDKCLNIIKDWPASTRDSFKETWQSIVENPRLFLLGIAMASPQITQCVAGGIKGAMYLDLSRMAKALGDLKAAEEVLQALIQMLQKLLKSFQSGVADTGDFVRTLGQFFVTIYKAADQENSKLNNAILTNTSG